MAPSAPINPARARGDVHFFTLRCLLTFHYCTERGGEEAGVEGLPIEKWLSPKRAESDYEKIPDREEQSN